VDLQSTIALPLTGESELTTPNEPAQDIVASAVASADELYSANAPLLRHIARRRYRIPSDEADALVHDVFATYIANAVDVREPRPYLVGAICNAARQYWRKRDAEKQIFCHETQDGPPGAEAEQLLESISRKLLIGTTLSRIGSRCRNLLRRYYLDGESTSAIAVSSDTTTDYVLLLLHNCRKRAREIARKLLRGS
jgi:RNA polymerase sigma factor (sigma-70 family)